MIEKHQKEFNETIICCAGPMTPNAEANTQNLTFQYAEISVNEHEHKPLHRWIFKQ